MKSQVIYEPKKFITDVSWVAFSQVLMVLTGLITLSVLTKSYDSELYGIWAQVHVTIGLLTTFLALQFNIASVRFLAAKESKKERRLILGTMFWTIVTLCIVIFIISLLLRQNLSMLIFGNLKYVLFIPLIFIGASMEALFLFFISYIRSQRRIKRLSLIRITLFIIKMLSVIFLSLAGFDLIWIVISTIIITALFVSIFFGIIIREIGFPNFSYRGLKSYLTYSIPQIPKELLNWVINSSDRYLIVYFLGLSQTGIYHVSYSLGLTISFVYISLGFVLFPTLTKSWEKKELSKVRNYFETTMKFYLLLSIPSVVGISILSQTLLQILATSEYVVGKIFIFIIASGVVFYGIYHINAYLIYLKKNQVWWIFLNIFGASANVSINIVLIPRIGIIGAAISTLVSFIILGIATTFWARKVIKYKISFKFLLKIIIASLIMGLCINSIKTDNIISVILTMIIGVAIYFLGLFIMRSFSPQDKELIKKIISAFIPKFWRGF